MVQEQRSDFLHQLACRVTFNDIKTARIDLRPVGGSER
jgi:hypothetical protein